MIDDVSLPGLVAEVALGRADSERLDALLFRGGLHPRALDVVGPVIGWAADPRLAQPLIMSTLVEVISHAEADPSAVTDALAPWVDTLLGLAVGEFTGESRSVPGEAAVLLGHCRPDRGLSARVREAAGEVTDPLLRVPLIVSAARLDPGGAGWLTGLLAPDRPPIVQGAAVVAMRAIGLPATDATYPALIRARLAHPDLLLLAEECRFVDLIGHLGERGDAALVEIAERGDAEARRDVLSAIRRGKRPCPLPGPLRDLVTGCLDDPDGDVRRSAYRLVGLHACLARCCAGRLAADLAAGHPERQRILHVLARIGHPGWPEFALEALTGGWAPPLAGALAALPFGDRLREAVHHRVGELARTRPSPAWARKEFMALLGLLTRHAEADTAERLHALLADTEVFRVELAFWLARAAGASLIDLLRRG